MKKYDERRSHAYHKRTTKPKTNKIIGKITYNPSKHKQKYTKKLRQKLQEKTPKDQSPPEPPTILTFGSFNVNGLDLEASWAVEELIKRRGIDVSINPKFPLIIPKF